MNPLEGLRVLDFTRALAGPYCTQLLAEMGAEVIKVETGDGDDARYLGPPFLKGESALFLCSNQNKKGIVVNIDGKQGANIIYDLVKNVDIVVENYRPGVMSKFGFDYKKLKSINPKIIYCSITAWGKTGPYKNKPGVDSIMQAMSGLSMISGDEGGPPIRIGTPIIDIATGIYAALAIVGAAKMRDKKGMGQYVELSLLNVALMLQLPKMQEYFMMNRVPERTGLYSSFGAIGGYFKTKTGYISLSIINDKYWRLLCDSIKEPSLINDKRFKNNKNRIENKHNIYDLLNKVLAEKTNRQWEKIFDQNGLLSGRIYNYKELFNDKNIKMPTFVAKAHHKKCGRISVLKCPIKMGRCRTVKKVGAPVLGEHTMEILKDLGYDDNRIRMLYEKRIVQ
ncbi:CoA transferase [Candidatus Parcubacteria bacterium]|nr:MAG: CoA transferase [Candidatus Parcubacteria bacterium]